MEDSVEAAHSARNATPTDATLKIVARIAIRALAGTMVVVEHAVPVTKPVVVSASVKPFTLPREKKFPHQVARPLKSAITLHLNATTAPMI